MQLPESKQISVSKLSQLFNSTTNSYKLLFFGAILNKTLTLKYSSEGRIKIKELADEMLLQAWYPSVFCHLSFGPQDQIANTITKLQYELEGSKINSDTHKETLKQAISEQSSNIGLKKILRYVPYRLLTPFFSNELKGLKDSEKNSLIFDLASSKFKSSTPIYKINKDKETIQLHPVWLEYFVDHYTIVHGWFAWHWCKYLQAKNSNVPAIMEKAFPPMQRGSLSSQINYWKDVMQEIDVKCIYTGELLNYKDFALDHYLPWSFVSHNQAWNLVPVHPSANLAKSNSLPHDCYFKSFLEVQYSGLKTLKSVNHRNIIEDYLIGLKITNKDIKDINKLEESYTQTMKPLEIIAHRMGFTSGWHL